MNKLKKRLSSFHLFLIVVLFSSFFRITNLSVIEFKADEAINLFLASRPLFGHPFPPGGTVSSVGILNPPVLNYILFPMTLISLDPKIISFFIGLINSIAIGFLFLILKRYFGLANAFIAAMFFAFSPWSILFSRKIWAQDFIIPLSVFLFYSLFKLVLEKKPVYWTGYVVFSLLLIQLHQSIIFFLLPLTIFLVLQKTKLNFKYIAVGFAIGILPLIPYLLYQISNGYQDYYALIAVKERLTPARSLSLLMRPFQIMGQGNFQFILGSGDMLNFSQNYPFVFQLRKLFYIEYLLLPIGMLIFWKNYIKFRFLVYITVLLPFIYFILRIEPEMHYFIILTPLLFLFIANVFYFMFKSNNSLFKLSSVLLFFTLILSSITFNFYFFKYLNEKKMLQGDYGTSFALSEPKTKEVFLKYQNQKDYQEMILASYVPQNLMYGYLPIAKMLYSFEETENNLGILEKKLKDNPDDARIRNEILAFYTSDLESKTLDALREKAKLYFFYRPIYKEAYNTYLSRKLKKVYDQKSMDIALEYPQHWALEEYPDRVLIKGDEYSVSIEKVTAATKKASLNVYKQIKSSEGFYTVFYIPELSGVKNQNAQDTTRTIDEIVASIREKTPFEIN